MRRHDGVVGLFARSLVSSAKDNYQENEKDEYECSSLHSATTTISAQRSHHRMFIVTVHHPVSLCIDEATVSTFAQAHQQSASTHEVTIRPLAFAYGFFVLNLIGLIMAGWLTLKR
jgi:hypothetical protein